MGLTAEGRDEFAKYATGRVPLGRFGAADEVARAALFLASDLASAVTGQMLTVDCGEFHR